MAIHIPLEELGRRGDELFDREIAARIPPGDPYRVVAIDVVSGDFAVEDDEVLAMDLLRTRHPDAQIWLRRVGWPYLHRHLSPFRPRRTDFRST
jgi:hypothetical protein